MYSSPEIQRYKQCLLRHRHQVGGLSTTPWGGIVYQGRRGQRGFGFGIKGILGKFVLPIVKDVGNKLLKSVLKGGQEILMEKKDPKSVLKARGKELLKGILGDASNQVGRGRRVGGKRSHSFLEYGGPPSKRARKYKR